MQSSLQLIAALLVALLTGMPLEGFAQRSVFWSQNVAPASASAPQFIQGCNASTASVIVICTFASNITPGDQLYLCLSSVFSQGSISWSGDGGSFTADPGNGTAISNINFGYFTSCVYVPSAGGGSASITASQASSYITLVGIEVRGGVFDMSDAGVAGSGTSLASNNITPSSSNSLLIGFGTTSGNGTFSPGTNVAWTLPASTVGSLIPGALEYFSQPTTVAVNAQFTQSSGGSTFTHIVSFKP